MITAKEKIEIINTSDGGYIITQTFCEEINDKGIKIYGQGSYVIEEQEDDNATMKLLLLKIAELSGHDYDKWKPDNLNITFDKKGHEIE